MHAAGWQIRPPLPSARQRWSPQQSPSPAHGVQQCPQRPPSLDIASAAPSPGSLASAAPRSGAGAGVHSMVHSVGWNRQPRKPHALQMESNTSGTHSCSPSRKLRQRLFGPQSPSVRQGLPQLGGGAQERSQPAPTSQIGRSPTQVSHAFGMQRFMPSVSAWQRVAGQQSPSVVHGCRQQGGLAHDAVQALKSTSQPSSPQLEHDSGTQRACAPHTVPGQHWPSFWQAAPQQVGGRHETPLQKRAPVPARSGPGTRSSGTAASAGACGGLSQAASASRARAATDGLIASQYNGRGVYWSTIAPMPGPPSSDDKNRRRVAPDQATRIVAPTPRMPAQPAPRPGASNDAATRIVGGEDAARVLAQVQQAARPQPRAPSSNEAATRIVHRDEVAAAAAAPRWKPAEVKRASAAPDTLAWEKDEGTVFKIVQGLKALTGGKAKPAAPAAPPPRGAVRPRELPFLDGVPDLTLDQAQAAGAMAVVELGRDILVDATAAAFLVVEGQLSLAEFRPDELAAERKAQAAVDPKDKKAVKKEAKRRMEAGPLIRLAHRNVAFFEKGDLVHLREAPPFGTAHGVYAVTPVVLVRIDARLLERMQQSYPFFADRVRRASSAARSRIDAVGGARSEVADFFIRHGLSVSQILRVRAIDKCIECKACENACEERYGAKRLSLGGRVLGTLDFVDACHTCTDQRCIDPCAFDAIKYDTEKKEVVIIEAACTGCTLCATACPYAAIEMHDFDDKPLLKLRLESQGKLGFGDGLPAIATQFGPIKARKAKAKRIASKCDHCIDYADQACISACPTGALVDVEPGDVFAARAAELQAWADTGYEHSMFFDAAKLNDPRIFQQGLSSKQADVLDKARAVKRISTTWMWVLGLGAFALAFAEILLRKLAPQYSGDYFWQTLVEHIDPEIALARVDFRAGCDFAMRLGYLGSALMFSGMLYPARRRIPWFKNLGAQRSWFDVHVLTGVIGPLLVALHTAAKLDTWVAFAVWAMVLVSVSGIAGRYLFTQLPEWASAAALAALEWSGRMDKLRPKHPGVRALDNWLEAYRKKVAAVEKSSPLAVLGWLAGDRLRRLVLGGDLRARVAGVVDPAARREAVRATLRLAHYERRRALLPRVEPLVSRWKWVHVPAAILLTVLGGIHIVLALFG